MKLLKRKGKELSTLRKVVSDDKKIVYGVVGTVGDLLEEGVFEFCDAHVDTCAFVNVQYDAFFAPTREEAIRKGGLMDDNL